MKKDERKAVYGIRGKLVSAVAMLLVACIMVVSSTYAWFTLSTAPEVSGIKTAVGANGALEMMLSAWNSGWNDGTEAANGDVNTTWGNLVDLSDAKYGSQKITLYPSSLNATNGSFVKGSYLSAPTYGPDGRMDELESTIVGKYDGTSFYGNDAYYGFRAVGKASGMTEREIAYRDALSAITLHLNSAINTAKASLDEKADPEGKSNGTLLADIAMMKGTQGNPVFKNVHLEAIKRMINKLEDSTASLEKVYVQSLLAYAASSLSGLSDDQFKAIAATVSDTTTYTNLKTLLTETYSCTIPEMINYGYAELTETKNSVTEAKTKANAITHKEDTPGYTWEEIKEPLTELVDVEKVTINGYTADVVKNHANDIINDYTSNKGITVRMATGSGVYSEIADQCGNYFTSIILDTKTMGISLGGEGVTVSATMSTNTYISPVYIKAILNGGNCVNGNGTTDTTDDVSLVSNVVGISGKAPAKGDAKQPLSEFYGYIIDLAFRTNAAQANLLLSGPKDRIYTDNNNEATMGHGSTMTFKSADLNFTEDKVKDLMENICIVFFATDATESGTQEILAYAKLDVANAEMTVDGVKANMYVYEKVNNAYEYTADGKKVIVYKGDDGKYYSDKDLTTEDANAASATLEPVGEVKVENNKITSLNQNAEKRISVLVYLDGTTIDNSDVSAAAGLTGTVNFQFATDATLTPMEYGDLHTPNKAPSTDSTPSTPSTNN